LLETSAQTYAYEKNITLVLVEIFVSGNERFPVLRGGLRAER
jgi:hypothetical protein